MIKLNGVPVVFEHYPDGESRWKPDDHGDCVVATVTLRYESDEDLIHLMLLKRGLDKMTDRTKLVFTHVPYARMDRAALGMCGFSLQYVAEFINWLGFRHVELRDPHSDVSAALFTNAVEVTCMDALVAHALGRFSEWGGRKDIVIVFPDAGAQKKYERFSSAAREKGRWVDVGFKHRSFESGKIIAMDMFTLHRGSEDALPTTAVIIDDISSYGGTFVQAAELLRKKYPIDDVHLVVAHCEDVAWDGDLQHHVQSITTTDSMCDRTDPEYAALAQWMVRLSQDKLLERSGDA